MKKLSVFIFTLIIIGFIYLIGSTIHNYTKFKPFFGNLINEWQNTDYFQSITDSVFIFKDMNDSIFFVRTNENLTYHFFDIKNYNSRRELKKVIKFNETLTKESKRILVFVNCIEEISEYSNIKNLDKIYRVDVENLPLKHKNILFPYTIEIKNDTLYRTYTGNIKL
jgi:hypothetical protein